MGHDFKDDTLLPKLFSLTGRKNFLLIFIFVSVRRREKELNKLYEKIAREFPFLVQQGLYTPRGEKVRTYKLEDFYKRLHLIFEKSSWKKQLTQKNNVFQN